MVLQALRYTALAEGVSYLILLFVAMPLKYGLGMDLAVRIAGMAHGILFIALGIALLFALWKSVVSLSMAITVFIASLIPFGAFWADCRLRERNRCV